MNNLPIFDGHNDVLLSLYLPDRGGGRSFFARGEHGHIDLPRAREGGLAGGFFAVFVPTEPEKQRPWERDLTPTEGGYEMRLADAVGTDYALRTAMAVTASLFRLEAESAGQVKVVRTASELETCLGNGVLAAILHFEGAEAIDSDLNALDVFYQAGLRSLGLVWSRPNAFACGVPFAYPRSPDTGPGLTDAGRRLVGACNRLGVLVDLAHINERGFWDVADITDAPLVVTHAGVHAICPATRNLTDKQLDAIGASGGVAGITYATSMIRPDGGHEGDVPLSVVVDHIAYIADRIGIEHVALGSDFDGAGMPDDLKDAAHLPNLIAALRERGFDDAALRKVTHENWLRVLRATWRA
ncbi:MAG TPA: dipeptidase [Ktedonobacterales bacterium]|nr:dipeptidase [Ktedonobacterales bacterium]